jgi:hypothetical protein
MAIQAKRLELSLVYTAACGIGVLRNEAEFDVKTVIIEK